MMKVDRGTGSLAVEVTGKGPLVVCVPGMGETRASFRHLSPYLVDAGYTVAAMDLRGHGDSSLDFDDFDDEAAAGDALATIDALGAANATVVGNSMGAAAGVLAASMRPNAVNGLILIGPFVRNAGSAILGILMRILLMRPWGPSMWKMYYRSLFGTVRVADHDDHVNKTLALLHRPGRWEAFRKTTRSSHEQSEVALSKVDVPTLVLMGEKDPDYRDPKQEAAWVADTLNGTHRMIPGAGHYPMGEQPQVVAKTIIPFLSRLDGKGTHNG